MESHFLSPNMASYALCGVATELHARIQADVVSVDATDANWCANKSLRASAAVVRNALVLGQLMEPTSAIV